MTILGHMLNTIPTYRDHLSPYAPKVIMFRIDPDKIRDVIGSGGKVITEIINDCDNVKITLNKMVEFTLCIRTKNGLRKLKIRL